MKQLHAYTLPTVLVISILICLLMLFAISLFNFNYLLYSHYHKSVQQKEDMNSMFVLYAKDSTLLKNIREEGIYQLYEDITQSTFVANAHSWGLYESVEMRATEYNVSSVRLYGQEQVGDTTKVDRAYLYLGNQYLKESQEIPMPEDIDFQSYYSFADYTRHFYVPDSLERFSARGNAVLHAEDVTLSSVTILSDIILMARKVIVEESFRGSLQIIATDTVILERNAKLDFPSGVYLKGNEDKTFLLMKEYSILNGYAVIFGKAEYCTDNAKCEHFRQSPSAVFNGLLYIDGGAHNHTRIYNNNPIGFPFFFKQKEYMRKELKVLH